MLFLAMLWLLAPSTAHAQTRYMTKSGQVSFFSATPLEDIDAHNKQVAAVLDLGTGQLAFSLPVKGFVFKRSLMQEHFNENYMESDKYPKATFTGRFVGLDAATLATPGPHAVQVAGDLTLHGVTRRIQVPASLELKGGQLLAAATFTVASADHGIEIPLLVRNKIAKTVTVRVALACTPVPSVADAARSPR